MQGNPTFGADRVTTSQAVATTTETAVATVVVTPGAPGQRVSLTGYVIATIGTGTTSVVTRIRKGSGITGAVVGGGQAVSNGINAGGNGPYPTLGLDQLGNDAEGVYTLTFQQNAASANGSVLEAVLQAVCHD